MLVAIAEMAGVAGLEPVTSAVTGQRSNQLSYTPAKGKETLRKTGENVKVWFEFFLIIVRVGDIGITKTLQNPSF